MIARALTVAANAFPAWVLLALVLGLERPELFTWFLPYNEIGLAVIMLGMGMTLSAADFAAVLRTPRAVAFGFAAQFTIMPAVGWAAATGFGLERDFAVGLILVACCPGGTASNVVTYLARANVPLSVLMTMCSTLGAVALTPLLTRAYAGALVEVPTLGLLISTGKVVVLPVFAGLALNRYAPRVVAAVVPVGPLVSVLTIALICGAIIGKNAADVREHGRELVAAVVTLHAGGFALGYAVARLIGFPEVDRRTVSIEVGMQNSGLGVTLAARHFSMAASVPCAISAVVHSVLGSVLAGLWRLFPPAPVPAAESPERPEEVAA